jgi:hypothetical protein
VRGEQVEDREEGKGEKSIGEYGREQRQGKGEGWEDREGFQELASHTEILDPPLHLTHTHTY